MNKNYSRLLLIILIVIASCKKKHDTKRVLNTGVLTNENFEKEEENNEEKSSAIEERWLHEFRMQRDPVTGVIPREEKQKEFENSMIQKQSLSFASRSQETSIVSRGPSNLGGRTRAFRIDKSDPTGNTMLAGGVSSGLFRTTNGGESWTKVSPFDEVHNVTSLTCEPILI